jgi:hypothetical protein
VFHTIDADRGRPTADPIDLGDLVTGGEIQQIHHPLAGVDPDPNSRSLYRCLSTPNSVRLKVLTERLLQP